MRCENVCRAVGATLLEGPGGWIAAVVAATAEGPKL